MANDVRQVPGGNYLGQLYIGLTGINFYLSRQYMKLNLCNVQLQGEDVVVVWFSAGAVNFRLVRTLSSSLALATLLIACGDGSSGAGGGIVPPVVEESQIDFDITFPVAGASLEGVRATTVSGTIDDVGDGALSLDEIQDFNVNGVPVIVDPELGRWHVDVALADAESVEFTATLEDTSGNSVQHTILVGNSPVQGAYKLVKLLADGSSALVYGTGRLRRVDLISGTESLVWAGLANGEQAPDTGIRVDATGRNAFLLRWEPYTWASDAFVVGLDTPSGESFGDLPRSEPYYYRGFDLDPVNGQLVYSYMASDFHGISYDRCYLMSIPIGGSTSRVITETSNVSATPGAPDIAFCPGPVVVDTVNNRVIVAADGSAGPDWWYPEPAAYGLYAYDLATGVGSVISPADTNSGPLLHTPQWMFLDSTAEHVISVDHERVLSTDLETGVRSVVTEDIDMPDDVTDVDYDELGLRLLIAHAQNRLSSIDLNTGELQELLRVSLGSPVGSGPELTGKWRIAPVVDTTRNRILVFERYSDDIYILDLDTLERSIITPQPAIRSIGASAATIDPVSGDLFFVDAFSDKVRRIDVENATQELVTSNDTSGGVLLQNIVGLSLDAQRGVLYASGRISQTKRAGLVSIDLENGYRRLIAEVPVREVNYPPELQRNVFDPVNDRVIATTHEGNVLAIDVATGEISKIYDEGKGEFNVTDGLALDAEQGRILLGLRSFSDIGKRELRTMDIETGSYTVISGVPVAFGFDEERALFYTLEDLLKNGINSQVFAVDRFSGAQATVARPE